MMLILAYDAYLKKDSQVMLVKKAQKDSHDDYKKMSVIGFNDYTC